MVAVTDYTGLITSEHASKPNFSAMVAAVAGCFVNLQNFLASMVSAFDVAIAQGVQLDQIGQWVGLSRNVDVPITVQGFSWNVAGAGWNQANWGSSTSGSITQLDDDTYRQLIYAKIGANSWNGNANTAAPILQNAFSANGAQIALMDNQDMTISFYFAGQPISNVMQAVLQQGLLALQSAGVAVAGYYMTSLSGAPLFGLDDENTYISGLDVGAWAIAI